MRSQRTPPLLPSYAHPSWQPASSPWRNAASPRHAMDGLAQPSSFHLESRASLPPDSGVALSAPSVHLPPPGDLVYQFPEMPAGVFAAYCGAHHQMCLAQASYATNYVSRGIFWKQANEMQKIVDGLEPPPPYSP